MFKTLIYQGQRIYECILHNIYCTLMYRTSYVMHMLQVLCHLISCKQHNYKKD